MRYVPSSGAGGPDAVAITLENNGKDDPYPAVYMRMKGAVKELLLAPHPLLDYTGDRYRQELGAWLKPVLGAAVTGPAS